MILPPFHRRNIINKSVPHIYCNRIDLHRNKIKLMFKKLKKFYSKQLPAYIAVGICLFSLPSTAVPKNITIAVLAPYGEAYTYKAWQPTIDYLQQRIPEYQFKLLAIEPSNVKQLKQMVANQQIDFSIVQPVTMTELQLKHKASAILSISGTSKTATFGSVIFSNTDSNITSLKHIKNRTIAAATPTGLGGWLIGYSTIYKYDNKLINLKNISFLGVQDNIVNAVLNRSVDVGIVRTGTLERMAREKKIQLSDFNIIHKQHVENFTELLSTKLYPEWALAKSSHISGPISKKIVSALLHIKSGSKVATMGGYWDWVPPLDYSPIRQLMMDFNTGEYLDDDDDAIYHLTIFVRNNPISSLTLLIFFVVVLVSIFWIIKLNNKLKKVNYFIAQQYEMILNSVSEGIFGVDLNGNCTFINKSLINILGWSESDLIGKHQHEIMHHTHTDGTPHDSKECPVYATFQDGIQKFIDEDMFWKKDGDGIYVEYSADPIKNKSGKIIGTVVVFRDITEQRKIKNYIQEMEHSARLNVMGEMVTEIAHELNQPLTTIATNSFTIANMMKSSNNVDNDKYLDTLNIISSQAEYAANIIRQLKKVSEKDQDEYISININQNIKNSIVLIQGMIKAHNIQIKFNLSSHLPDVKIQSVQINQVIINLCKNAIEAMIGVEKNARTLSIKSVLGDKDIIVSIGDTGVGINDESQLFNTFSTNKKNGMGIGLSISRSIIERHGGNLYLDKTSTTGSKFTFTIPIE